MEKKKVMVVMLKRRCISSIFSPKKDTVVEKEPVDRGCFVCFFFFLNSRRWSRPAHSAPTSPQLRPSLRETILVQGDTDKSLIYDPFRDRIRNCFLHPASHCAAVPLLPCCRHEAAARRLRLHCRSECPNPICCPCSNILFGTVCSHLLLRVTCI